jgi:tight adherence protein B
MILLGQNTGITCLLAWLFYDSYWGLLLLPFVWWLNSRRYLTEKKRKWEEKLGEEYKEMLLSVSSSLQAGYSVEHAFEEAERSLKLLYQTQSVLLPGIERLNGQVRLRVPIETAFLQMAEAYKSEDLIDFAVVFGFGKLLGGGYVQNIKETAAKISQRVELMMEIRTCIAEKQLELKAMTVMPVGMLAYMRLTAADYMGAVYHNPMGIAVMTVALFVYAGSIWLGRHIINISI